MSALRVETAWEQLLFTTVLLGTKSGKGETGIGTSFIYRVPIGPEGGLPFLVTNKHVVEGVVSMEIRFLASKDREMAEPDLGSCHAETVTDIADGFFGHPDPRIDVAVAPLLELAEALRDQDRFPFFRAIEPGMSMTDENVDTLDAIEEITFIGYPNGLYDQVNYLPIARRGFTATHPVVDYNGEPVFLVDASVFPGSSGSPVFLLDTFGHVERGGGIALGNRRFMFLGMVAAVYQRSVPVLQLAKARGSFVRDAIDIGIVYKAQAIDHTVDLFLAKHGMKRYVAPPEPAGTGGPTAVKAA